MPDVAITGATGFVGKHVLARLSEGGFSSRPLVRTKSALSREQIIGALETAGAWVMEPIDAFIHLAARTHVMKESANDALAAYRAINVEGTKNALRAAARAGCRHFVFLSSVKAIGEESQPNQAFDEETTCRPEDAYGISKLEAEQLVRQFCEAEEMAWTIVRPPLVYGPGVKANFAAFAKLSTSNIPLPLASSNNRRSLIHVENLSNFLVFVLQHPATRNRTFVVDDGTPISTPELLEALAKAQGSRARLFPFPPQIAELIAQVLGKSGIYQRLFKNLELDSSAARSTGWSPPLSMEQGLSKTFSRI